MPTFKTAPDPDDGLQAPPEVLVFENEIPPEPKASGPKEVESAEGRSKAYVVGGLVLAAGLAALLVGLLGDAIAGIVRAVLVLIGLIVTYRGLRQVGVARFGKRFDLSVWLAGFWLALIVVLAILAPILPLSEYSDTAKTITEPSFAAPDLLSAHPFGTNNFGLDLMARVIYGARASLVVAVSASVIGMVVGGAIGVLAGYLGRKVDTVVGVLTNSLLAIPALILLIALSAVLAPNLFSISFALSLLAIPAMIRIARANTMVFAQREFVLAARSMGATRWRVMVKELVPNVALPVASLGMVMISVLIVAEASLSFLGLGIQAPRPTWGNMIAEGQGGIFEQHPFIVLVPGLVLFLTVFSFNLVGEKSRQGSGGQQAMS